jgi:hypothetical protein
VSRRLQRPRTNGPPGTRLTSPCMMARGTRADGPGPDTAWQQLSCGDGAHGPSGPRLDEREASGIGFADRDATARHRWVPFGRSLIRPEEIDHQGSVRCSWDSSSSPAPGRQQVSAARRCARFLAAGNAPSSPPYGLPGAPGSCGRVPGHGKSCSGLLPRDGRPGGRRPVSGPGCRPGRTWSPACSTQVAERCPRCASVSRGRVCMISGMVPSVRGPMSRRKVLFAVSRRPSSMC